MASPNVSKPEAPARRLIAKFGGITAAAAALRRATSTVQRWSESGFVPPKHHDHVLAVAAARKISLDLGDFLSIDLKHPAFKKGERTPSRQRARPVPARGVAGSRGAHART